MVVDIVKVDWGNKEIEIVEIEMLGLMVFWEEYGVLKFFKGICIVGLFYMMI